MIIQIEPWIDEKEKEQLDRVVASTFVVEHDLTKEFEELTKELTQSPYAVAVCNGTAALFCCLKAMGIGPGDEVIVPNLTFVASANAVILAGAKPVLCEIDQKTFCIDPDLIESRISPRTKAIMPVHLYGQCADMDAIMAIATKHNLLVLEDAAQGVGVTFGGRHAGTMGHMGVLSYYGNKTITCGEGGVILTKDPELRQAAYRLKNHGRDVKGTFIHEHIGFNFSFTEMQAAVGIAQMHKLPDIIEKKRQIHDRYCRELEHLCEVFTPAYIDERSGPVFWFTSFLAKDREELAVFLKDQGIQTRLFFYPLHKQPCYQSILDCSGDFSISEQVYDSAISLPSAYHLTDEDQTKVISAIKDFYARRS